jgi:HlyD family secretion protein
MIKKRVKRILIIFILIFVIGAIAYFSFSKKEEVEYTTAKVQRGKIVQTVSETGTVKASSEINLNFLNSGRVAKILVGVGEKVKKDQLLAELDYSSLSIKEREAQANLDKIIRGATSVEVAVKQANVSQTNAAYLAAMDELEKIENNVNENIAQAEKTLNDLESDSSDNITTYEQAVKVAQTSLNNAKKTYKQSIENEEDDAITVLEAELSDADTALDTINTILNDPDTSGVLSVKNAVYLENTKNSREQANILSNTADTSLDAAKLNMVEANINNATQDAKSALNKTFESLSYCFDALENSITSTSFTQAELDAYKTNISADLTIILTSISNVQTAQQDLEDARLDYETNVSDKQVALVKAKVDLDDAIINARNALNSAQTSGDQQITVAQSKVDNAKEAWEVAKAQLAEIKAPARSEDVVLQKAALDSVKKQIEDSIIKAPIDGTITKVNYEVGEQTSAGEPVVSMLAENNFEIEIDISEADIAKINLNNPVIITLDAFGDDIVFVGKVYFLEPAETVIQDVIYYKTKIEFISDANLQKYSSNIKSGMTANAVITTSEKENALIMPSRAVVQRNGDRIARVLVSGAVQEAPITTGLRGDEGMVEVLSGVKEGDEVITLVKNSK